MKLRVAAIGERMPAWINDGWREYARRFPPHLNLELREIPSPKRGRNAPVQTFRRREGEALVAAIEPGDLSIALDEDGQQWTTREIAERMRAWAQEGTNVTFLIGGADGLSQACLERTDLSLSLGRLTLPHALVRVVLVEQLYRAWTITQNHPYHRE